MGTGINKPCFEKSPDAAHETRRKDFQMAISHIADMIRNHLDHSIDERARPAGAARLDGGRWALA